MRKTDLDKFEISQDSSIIKNNNSDNFFNDSSYKFDFKQKNASEPVRRLNDYDFNLLREDAYKDVTDDVFKLEYKIAKTEDELKLLDSQIITAKEIADEKVLEELYSRKSQVLDDYEALIALYNDKSISTKIIDFVSKIFGVKVKNIFSDFNKNLTDISYGILSKLPGRFSSILEIKKSLNKLENINRSVDELMSMNVSHYENINKYDQLSKYIIRANSIQAEINHYLR